MQCSFSILYRFRLSLCCDQHKEGLSNNTLVGSRKVFKKLGSHSWENGLPDFEKEDVAAQVPAGREPVWERQKHLRLNAGTGSQTSPERVVSTGTAVGHEWPAVPMEEFNCSERYCEERNVLWAECKKSVKFGEIVVKGKSGDWSRQLK